MPDAASNAKSAQPPAARTPAKRPQVRLHQTQTQTSDVANLQQSIGNSATAGLVQNTFNGSERLVLNGAQPLDSALRSMMESRFRHDFSRVRIHTGPEAASLARSKRARAFTQGQDIVFAAGAYAPQETESRKLVAHELTHVVQQAHGGVTMPGPGHEQEAEAASRSASTGSDTTIDLSAAPGSVQCAPEPPEAAKRKIFIDSQTMAYIAAGRHADAEQVLKGLAGQGHQLFIAQQTYNELFFIPPVIANATTPEAKAKKTAIEADLARRREKLKELNITIGPKGTLAERAEVYEKNFSVQDYPPKIKKNQRDPAGGETRTLLSEPDLVPEDDPAANKKKKGRRNDVLVAAQAKAAGAEIFSIDGDFLKKQDKKAVGPKEGLQEVLGVRVAPESWSISHKPDSGPTGGGPGPGTPPLPPSPQGGPPGVQPKPGSGATLSGATLLQQAVPPAKAPTISEAASKPAQQHVVTPPAPAAPIDTTVQAAHHDPAPTATGPHPADASVLAAEDMEEKLVPPATTKPVTTKPAKPLPSKPEVSTVAEADAMFKSLGEEHRAEHPGELKDPKNKSDVHKLKPVLRNVQQQGAPTPLSIPREGIEMPWVGKKERVNSKGQVKSGSSELGYLRDSRKYWRKYAETWPDQLSEKNKAAIKNGRAPKIDDTWLKHHPEHGAYKDDTLEHHHVGQGSLAVPVPTKLHDAHTVFHQHETVLAEPGKPVDLEKLKQQDQAVKGRQAREIQRHVDEGRIAAPGLAPGQTPPVQGKIPLASQLAGVSEDELRPVKPLPAKNAAAPDPAHGVAKPQEQAKKVADAAPPAPQTLPPPVNAPPPPAAKSAAPAIPAEPKAVAPSAAPPAPKPVSTKKKLVQADPSNAPENKQPLKPVLQTHAAAAQNSTPAIVPSKPPELPANPPAAKTQQPAAPAIPKPSTPAAPTPASAAAQQSPPPAKQPSAAPTVVQAPPPAHSKERSVETSRSAGLIAGPNQLGARGAAGIKASQTSARGVKTDQTINIGGKILATMTEVPLSTPPKFQVTVTVDLTADASLGASREPEGKAGAGVNASLSGSLRISFTTPELSEEEAKKYIGGVQSGAGGSDPAQKLAGMIANRQLEEAKAYIRQLKTLQKSASGAKDLAEGASDTLETGGRAEGGINLSKGKFGVGVSISKSGQLRITRTKKNGKLYITVSVIAETGKSLSGSASVGVASMGISGMEGESRSQSVTFVLDPEAQDFQARYDRIFALDTIDDLRSAASLPSAVSQTSGKGKTSGISTKASVAGVGITFHKGGSYSEEETKDADGVTRSVEGSGYGGATLTAGDKNALSFTKTDTFRGTVGPDNKGTGETRTTTNETDLTKSATALGKSLRKDTLGTVKGVVTGGYKVIQDSTDSGGKYLDDDSFGRIAALAEDSRAWDKSWAGSIDNFIAWRALRGKIRAANGDRAQIQKLLAQFESEGTDRNLTINKAVGEAGEDYEFPDAISNLEPTYRELVRGNPTAHARELASAGRVAEAKAELDAVNGKLEKLMDAIRDHANEFKAPEASGAMLNSISKRRAMLRTEIRRLTPAAPKAPPPERVGPPTLEESQAMQAANNDQEAARKDQEARINDLIRTCLSNRAREQANFAAINQEFEKDNHWYSKSDIYVINDKLNELKGLYVKWDDTLKQLRSAYKDHGDSEDKANQYAPNRAQFNALHRKANGAYGYNGDQPLG